MNYFFTFLLLLPLISLSQNKWVLEKNSNGIKVYTREVEESGFQEVMVKLRSKGTLIELKDILMDIDNYERWVYNTNVSKVLKRVSHNEVIYYTEFHIPWPASNRDLVAHVNFITDSIPNTYFIRSQSLQGYLPAKNDIVRINNSRTTWKIQQLEHDLLDIEYIIRVDPEGNIPAWVVNMTNITGPYNSFVKLKELLEK